MTLFVKDRNGEYRIADRQEILAAARSSVNQLFKRGRKISHKADSIEFFQMKLAGQEKEVFAALYLDTPHRIIAYEELFVGTIDTCQVHPREIVKRTLLHNAAAVIFGHNHPSGSEEPSLADMKITERLKEALQLIDVRVLDHIVVGKGATSLAGRGLL
ncbi:MAG: DNA repair protein RadC [Candidatus Competibacteraceae bacterium]|nr:DNA repair protein RadC [Candidatus Competibacteraceae bacterium]